MTDDFESFRRIDSAGYAADRPGGTHLLRRARKQIRSLLEFPDPCSLVERKNQAEEVGNPAEFAKLYTANPRALLPPMIRRIPKNTTGVKVDVALSGGPESPFSGGLAGEVRIKTIVRGQVRASEWQTVADTAVEVYHFEADTGRVSREEWATIVVEGRSFAASDLEERRFTGRAYRYQGAHKGTESPYGEEHALFFEDDQAVDFVLYRGERALLTGTETIDTDFYVVTPAPGAAQGTVKALNWLSAPYGCEVRLVKESAEVVGTSGIKAGRIPYASSLGVGALREGAREWVDQPVTSSLGAVYEDKPGASWPRYPRTWRHTASDVLELEWTFRPINPAVRVQLGLAVVGVQQDEVTRAESMGDILSGGLEHSFDARLRLVNFDGTIVATGTGELVTTYYPLDVSGASPYLLERWAALNGGATDGWTYRDGQLFTGRHDRAGELGDLALVNVVQFEADLSSEDFGLDDDLETTFPLKAILELNLSGQDQIDGSYELNVLGSSIQQYHLAEAEEDREPYVYIGDSSGNVYAIHAETGAQVWISDVGTGRVNGLAATPAGDLFSTFNDHRVRRLARADGTQMWVTTTGDDARGVGSDGGAVNVTLRFGASDELVQLKASDGSVEWADVNDNGYALDMGPDGSIYVGLNGPVEKWSSAGTRQWASSAAEAVSAIVWIDGLVFTGTNFGTSPHKIQKWDASTGAEDTSGAFPIDVQGVRTFGNFSTDGTHFFAGVITTGGDEVVWKIGPSDGYLVGTYDPGASYNVRGVAAAPDGHLYVAVNDTSAVPAKYELHKVATATMTAVTDESWPYIGSSDEIFSVACEPGTYGAFPDEW